MAIKIQSEPPLIADEQPSAVPDRIGLIVAFLVLGGAALALWVLNGPAIFATMITSALALCF